MILAALLATAAPQSAAEADRALAAAVETEGQWTAFRRFAAPEAIIFQNGPHRAAMWLAGRRDPATGIAWTIAESITSCDGTTAFTAGPVRRQSGQVGTLLLIWRRQPDGSWKWAAWRGAATARTVVPRPRMTVASCEGRPLTYVTPRPEGESGTLWSPDRTFWWSWQTDRSGAVTYSIRVWNGTSHVAAVSGSDERRGRNYD